MIVLISLLHFFCYCRFSSAALAFEQCDSKFRAVFAEPRPQKNQSTGSFPENYPPCNSGGSSQSGNFSEDRYNGSQDVQTNECVLSVICSPLVKLFEQLHL